jgi:tetratricopeptide (TPR) repeat protein
LYHPNRDTLERFARGELPDVEARWIDEHVRSGCPICQSSIDALLPVPEPVSHAGEGVALNLPAASTAPPAMRAHGGGAADPGLALPWQALSLPSLPRQAPGELERAALRQGAGGGLDSDSDSDVWSRMVANVGKRVSRITSERQPAPRLLAELLAADADDRAAMVRLNPRFQTLALCDLLIEASGDAACQSGGQATGLAELGILMAQHLDEGHYGSALVADLQARAWAYLGRARRLNGDLAGAKQALAIAETLAERGSADPLEEARLLDLKANLLSDQECFEEAAELMDMVIEIYDEVQDPHRKGQSLIAKGQYLGLSGSPDRAIATLAEGLSLLDREIEPRLALLARHSLAWFLNDCGDFAGAQRELDGCRQVRGPFWEPEMALRSEWLEARIVHRAGRFEEAETRFRRLRLRFTDLGRRYEALMVTLDLARLYLEQGRKTEVYPLIDEALPVLLAQSSSWQAATALGGLQPARDRQRGAPALAQDLARYLRRPSQDCASASN